MKKLRAAGCFGLLALGVIGLLAFGALAESEGSDGEAILALETRLSELGYFAETPDATGDEHTRLALGNFQTANNLEATGAPDRNTLDRLHSEDCVSKSAYLRDLAARYREMGLEAGAFGNEVAALQRVLAGMGYYSGREDGVFGEATGDAVSLFQLAAGLPVTGVADGATLYRLLEGEMPTREEFLNDRCAEEGDSGNRVKLAQQRLKASGFFTGDCTGVYGDMTAAAVERFQKANGLAVSGTLDLETCAALYSLKPQTSQPEAMQLGDSGDAVREIQGRLADLGYYAGETTGVVDTDTRTALCLYAIANGGMETALQNIDPETDVACADAGEAFERSRLDPEADAAEEVARTAKGMLGRTFRGEGAGTRFPGFAFVQFVFAQNGIAFLEPGEIIGETNGGLSTDKSPEAGSIVVLEREQDGGTQLRLTISLGEGRLALLDESGQYVVSGDLGQEKYERAYVWTPGGSRE